jgi:hypothetical protein
MGERRHINFTIAELTAQISLDAAFPLRIDGNLRKFTSGGHRDRTVSAAIGVRVGALPVRVPQEVIFDSGSVWRLCGDARGQWFELRSPLFGNEPYKVAAFSSDYAVGEVTIRPDVIAAFDGSYPLEYPLDELLWIHLLSMGLGIEVHGCGIVDEAGVGRLFVGASGAGKSTTAGLWSRHRSVTVLSDDRVILRRDRQGVWMHGTPWHGDAAFGSPTKARLSQIFFLRHGLRNQVAPLPRALAVSKLMATSFLPFHSAKRMLSSLTFCEEIVAEVRCAQLDFVPDQSAVSYVSELPR